MKPVSRFPSWACAVAICAFSGTAAKAAIVVEIAAQDLQTEQLGTLFPTNALVQLVNLGADGAFNPIALGDGGSQWVSGDDTLLSFNIGSSEGHTTDRFDVAEGAGQTGFLLRTFDFSAVPTGTRLGIRWFPAIAATAFDATGSALLADQTRYGQFTRQGAPLNAEGDPTVIPWIVPANVVGVTQAFRFDPLVTATQGGADPNSAGVAGQTVIPEPSSALLLAFGALGMLARRRR
jgi:hypothetical protein